MNLERRNALYDGAVNKWGFDAQLDMILEEMSELQKALLKFRRAGYPWEDAGMTKAVLEELVDVEVMVEQFRFIFAKDKAKHTYKLMKSYKLKRLEDLLNSHS